METFLGTILAFGFNFAPRGWQLCSGQLLSIAQNNALFALLGTTYGGNGQTTFALPDLRGRSLVGMGQGPGLTNITQGEISGTESTTLLITNMPMHAHALVAGQALVNTVANALADGTIGNDPDNGNNSFAAGGNTPSIYSESGTATKIGGITTTISGTTGIAGGSQPFGIRNPYLGINYSIAIEGIFPSRN
ncbi:tail fiber protein [Flavobacterium sp. MMLR14_040]|uniref:phage tail protein n=1 Tax=Flavobacterium sp. MMLR14_040 TaxID=3093843 RepID=UPI00299023BE|nr:tail fiber protein [Flavobacterium sp. MMLR14_040]MDW8850806.1 tail fiber protein [Flavobacterium sp. MMLR14_040]